MYLYLRIWYVHWKTRQILLLFYLIFWGSELGHFYFWGILFPTGHGQCVCRKCICDANYAGRACDCPLDTSTCLASNKQICNGRGTCECGVCKCTDSKFQGPTCEICPTCPGVCTEHKCVINRIFTWTTGSARGTKYIRLCLSSQGLCPVPSIWYWWQERDM